MTTYFGFLVVTPANIVLQSRRIKMKKEMFQLGSMMEVPPNTDPRVEYFKGQFKELVKMLQAVENTVMTEGPMDSRILDKMAADARLSDLGRDAFASLIKESPKLKIVTVGALKMIQKNPEYREDGRFPLE